MQLLVFCANFQVTTPQITTLPLAARGGDRNGEGEDLVGADELRLSTSDQL